LAATLPPLLVLALFASSCVVNRPARPSMPESAQGPSAPPVTGSPVVARTSPPDGDDAPPATNKPGATWVRGYWHWDGVRYVWERGRWERLAAPATAP
jgi:hypothetical protein